MANYPATGYYRFFMQNDGPSPATKYATGNGQGFQVTADRTDGINHERQRWYINANGANVVFYKDSDESGIGLVTTLVNKLDSAFVYDSPQEWTLEAVDADQDDLNFYIRTKDKTKYLTIQEYGVVVVEGDPTEKKEFWRFIAATASTDAEIPFGYGWLPSLDMRRKWRQAQLEKIKRGPKDESEWHPAIQDFKKLIDNTPNLFMGFGLMFQQTWQKLDGRDEPQVTTVDEMLQLFDSFIYDAPEFDVQSQWGGLIAFPFNAVIDWPMTTPAGAALFTSPAVNAAFKKVFDAWAVYLHSKASASVLNEQTGWLSQDARNLLSVPKYDDPQTPYAVPFYDAFKPGPGNPEAYYGFTCWDDFFTRHFKDEVRPLEDSTNPNVIVAGCESDVQRIYRNVKPTDQFWVKSQPYSVLHLLNHDPHYSKYFVQDWDEKTQTGGATVFQAFLSAKSYHRWHTPVGGRILKIVEVAGTYYAVSPEAALDPGAPDLSQPYICQTATRALIFIDADDPIGLMCFVAVGMSEVSTCEVTVKAGQTVEKGDELGTFHHGGSTHCLVFPHAVGSKLTFFVDGYPENPPNEWAPKNAPHINLKRKIAEFPADT